MSAAVEHLPAGFREQPHNIDAEVALLGAILINNDAYRRVAEFLRPEHFYEPVHGKIYEAMARRIRAGRIADHVLVQDLFAEDEKLAEIEGGAKRYLEAMVHAGTSIESAQDYGRLIRDRAVSRALIRVTEDAGNAIYNGAADDIGALIEQVREQLERLHEEAGSDISTALNGAALDLSQLADRTPPDRLYAWEPWMPARMVTLLHGYGGSGKSLLAQQIGTAYALGFDLFRRRDARPARAGARRRG